MQLDDFIDEIDGWTPPIAIICGDPGTGKTTLAGLFANPVFIQCERSSTVFQRPEWAECKPTLLRPIPDGIGAADAITAQLDFLLTGEHAFETVVIDTISTLDRSLETEVVDTCPKQSGDIRTAWGGYGAGRKRVDTAHRKVFKKLEALRDHRGMAVVMLCHTGSTKLDCETGESMTLKSMALPKETVGIYTAESDVVGYLMPNDKVVATADGKKKRMINNDDRVLITGIDRSINGYYGPARPKNRYNFDVRVEVPLFENPLLQLFTNETGE